MKRFLSLCLLVGFSILLAPSVSMKYQAVAGRTVVGDVAGEECDCDALGPPVCYYENSSQPCNGNYRSLQEPAKSKPQPTGVDTGSLGLLLLTAFCLLRRFI